MARLTADDLVLEVRDQPDETPEIGPILLTPPVGDDYWAYRVRVADGQAVIGFPKFGTIGIGFAVEEDWNTNLPYSVPAHEILRHIAHNRGPLDEADLPLALRAIEMISARARTDRGDDA